MPKVQANVCEEREGEKSKWGLQVKHIQKHILFFDLSVGLNFFNIVGNKQVANI